MSPFQDSPAARRASGAQSDWQPPDQPKQPRYVIMMISVTEERGVDGVPWRLSLDVPAGWRLVQVLPQGEPDGGGSIMCALERVG